MYSHLPLSGRGNCSTACDQSFEGRLHPPPGYASVFSVLRHSSPAKHLGLGTCQKRLHAFAPLASKPTQKQGKSPALFAVQAFPFPHRHGPSQVCAAIFPFPLLLALATAPSDDPFAISFLCARQSPPPSKKRTRQAREHSSKVSRSSFHASRSSTFLAAQHHQL